VLAGFMAAQSAFNYQQPFVALTLQLTYTLHHTAGRNMDIGYTQFRSVTFTINLHTSPRNY
jgi:hypothetical protein